MKNLFNIIILMMLPICTYACVEIEKPILLVELDSHGVKKNNCTDYEFIAPKEFKGNVLNQINFYYGEQINRLEFILDLTENGREDKTLSSYICANSKWLSQAKVELIYKSKQALLCIDSFEYKDLNIKATKSTCNAEGCCNTRECVLSIREKIDK
jgi:hypothetical protein